LSEQADVRSGDTEWLAVIVRTGRCAFGPTLCSAGLRAAPLKPSSPRRSLWSWLWQGPKQTQSKSIELPGSHDIARGGTFLAREVAVLIKKAARAK